MHPTFSKSVTLFSLNLVRKSTGSMTEKCCWCRNCSSDLQHCRRCDCLPARQCTNTSHSWHGWASVPWDTPFINRDMWPANITDINPVDYHHLVMSFYLKFKLPYSIITDCSQSHPLFRGNDITSIRWTLCISQGSAITFFRCDRQMHNHLCQISSGFSVPKMIKIGSFLT